MSKFPVTLIATSLRVKLLDLLRARSNLAVCSGLGSVIRSVANAICEALDSNPKGSFKDEAALKLLAEQDWSISDIGTLSSIVVSQFIDNRKQFAEAARNAIAQDADIDPSALTGEQLEELMDSRCVDIATDVAFKLVWSFVDLVNEGRNENCLLQKALDER